MKTNDEEIYNLCIKGREYLYDKEIELLKELDKAKNENMRFSSTYLTLKIDDIKIEIEKANSIIEYLHNKMKMEVL